MGFSLFHAMVDERFMSLALEQASAADAAGEVPVGCVIVGEGGEVLSRAHNLREGELDPTAHAELIAIRRAAEVLGTWRLTGVTLYVTLEPCAMCMGAALLARVARVVFGARDPKGGAAVSLYALGSDSRLNHTIEITEGVLEGECSRVLSGFFKRLRDR